MQSDCNNKERFKSPHVAHLQITYQFYNFYKKQKSSIARTLKANALRTQ